MLTTTNTALTQTGVVVVILEVSGLKIAYISDWHKQINKYDPHSPYQQLYQINRHTHYFLRQKLQKYNTAIIGTLSVGKRPQECLTAQRSIKNLSQRYDPTLTYSGQSNCKTLMTLLCRTVSVQRTIPSIKKHNAIHIYKFEI